MRKAKPDTPKAIYPATQNAADTITKLLSGVRPGDEKWFACDEELWNLITPDTRQRFLRLMRRDAVLTRMEQALDDYEKFDGKTFRELVTLRMMKLNGTIESLKKLLFAAFELGQAAGHVPHRISQHRRTIMGWCEKH